MVIERERERERLCGSKGRNGVLIWYYTCYFIVVSILVSFKLNHKKSGEEGFTISIVHCVLHKIRILKYFKKELRLY